MSTHVDIAVMNNILWCQMVCETHGAKYKTTENTWGLLTKAPPFYPDIITSKKNVSLQEVINFIGNRPITSIKDSFSNLDLEPFGFQFLFEAKWMFHDPISPKEAIHHKWHVIQSEDELREWTSIYGWDGMIKTELLKRNEVEIFIRENDNNKSGFITNLGAGAVGISNVFSERSSSEGLWSEIVQEVSDRYRGFPLVGYEHGEELEAALSAGWKTVGPLRVWLKNN